MKFTLTIFLCAAVFSTVFSYAHAHDIGKETTMKQEQLNDKDIIVKIDGMSCEPCVETIKKVFNKEESVTGAFVVLEDQTLTLDITNGKTLSDAKIKELVEWAGFDLISIKRLKS